MRVISANVNGIRAAVRRGGMDWLAAAEPDVLVFQETRATPAQFATALAGTPFADWQSSLVDSGLRPGHAGVAVLTPGPHTLVASPLAAEFAEQGRWVVVDVAVGQQALRLASVYVHTGDAEKPELQDEKHRFLASLGDWLAAHGEHPALVCGDLNVAHAPADIKNWRGNRGKAGFLESERAHLTRWYAEPADGGLGWTDTGRAFAPQGPGPYTWWSWRGKAFDTDAGWRIDVALASPALAGSVKDVTVGRAATYAQRWSDHAPLIVDLGVA